MSDTVFDRHAAGLRKLLDELPQASRSGERALAERAAQILADYEGRLEQARVPAFAIGPARLAFAVRIDQAARALPRIGTSAWLAAAHTHLFDRRDVTIDTIRRFRDTAAASGGDYAELARFLADMLTELETTRRTRRGVSIWPAIYTGLGAFALILALSIYALYLDFRYHEGIREVYAAEIAELPATPVDARLTELAEASFRAARASDAAPLSRLVVVPLWASGTEAQETYRAEVAALLPGAIRDAIGDALATEGDDLALYDTLRAWSVLTGAADWTPDYLAGWLEDRGMPGLSRHVFHLDGPSPGLPVPNEDHLAQATAFAAAAPEADRAFLELARQSAVRALDPWQPSEVVPAIAEVFTLRSGRSLSEGIPGLFTVEGWDYAGDIGIGVAVQTTRAEAARLFGTQADRRNDAPDIVLARLQVETLQAWQTWLEDLRVLPFTDQDSALRISGELAQRRSPLERLFRAAWEEVGGEDRTRPFELQLLIADAFEEPIAYLDSGRIAEISALFAALNVALGSIEIDDERGADQLMSLQERARTIEALEGAPPLIVQITEDVLAQTSAAHASVLTNPLVRQWQGQVFPLCVAVMAGQYPFGDGGDADLAAFAQLFGPQGAMQGFFRGHAEPFLDTSGEVWRWRPEARISGVSQDSAAFLQRAIAVSSGFFDESGQIGRSFEIAVLAERGEAAISVGGTDISLRATDARQTLTWPGPDPEAGAEILIRREASLDSVAAPGPWGLLRVLDQTAIRTRDEGRRQLIDLRTERGRLFFEIVFDAPLNPVSARRAVDGMTCPPVL